jgi:hypothetical protein
MADQGYLRESKGSPWSSPVRLVPQEDKIADWIRKHGERSVERLYDPIHRDEVAKLYRLTGDFRRLNEATILEVYPLPRIDDLLDKCQGATRFTCTDIEDAFFTIELGEESRPYTAFTTHFGVYEYTRMAQGLRNAATAFARAVRHIFNDLMIQKMMVYQDDVVNYESSSLSAHLDLQQQIYYKLEQNQLVVNPAKTHLNYRTQKILGHVLSAEGRRADPGLVKAITELAPPTTIEGVRSLLGLAQVAMSTSSGSGIRTLTANKRLRILSEFSPQLQYCSYLISRSHSPFTLTPVG